MLAARVDHLSRSDPVMTPPRVDPYEAGFVRHPLPMWIVDLESCRFLAVNDAAVRHYGFSREEFLAMSATEVRPPEDVPALLDAVAEAARGWPETVMTAPATWRHRKKSGELIDVEIYWSPIEFEGHPASLAMLSDTTDRKLAEKRLYHQARLLQALQDVAVAANQATSNRTADSRWPSSSWISREIRACSSSRID